MADQTSRQAESSSGATDRGMNDDARERRSAQPGEGQEEDGGEQIGSASVQEDERREGEVSGTAISLQQRDVVQMGREVHLVRDAEDAATAISPGTDRQAQHSSGVEQASQRLAQPATGPDAETRRGANGFSALVEAFMNGFRQSMAAATQTQTPQSTPPQPAPAPDVTRSLESTAESRPADATDATPSQQATSSAETATSSETDAETTATGPRTLFFRMPMFEQGQQNGQGAVLAFHPGPIPVPPSNNAQGPPQFGPDLPPQMRPERGNGQASGFHLPAAPIFVPLGTSPLPFSFLFDPQVNTAWPIASISYGPPGALPPENPNPNLPQFVAGPPFHIALNISFGPPPEPERPDPERANRFVASLERADAELRSRMARLGLGVIGDFGGRQDNESGHDAAVGCGICFDEYPAEDRPEWIGGQASIDEEVVAVPCAGHHTLHHRCLYEWLANTPPSQWTCPFCRAPLDKGKVEESARTTGANRTAPQSHAQSAPSVDEDEKKKAQRESRARTLREDIRLRERGRGWRCDSPACLPRYPCSEGEDNTESTIAVDSTSVRSRLKNNDLCLISLHPCRHKLHVDCLCTSMKLEQAKSFVVSSDEDRWSDDDDDDDEEEEYEKKVETIESTPTEVIPSAHTEEEQRRRRSERSEEYVPNTPTNASAVKKRAAETVGKWVTCPLCRHEAWAELPVRRRPKRVEHEECDGSAGRKAVNEVATNS